MRTKFWILTAGVVAAATTAALPASAGVNWSGAGYYVEDFLLNVIAGPFSSEADCKAAIAANAPAGEEPSFACSYYSSKKEFDEQLQSYWRNPPPS